MITERPDRVGTLWKQLIGTMNNNRDYWFNPVSLISILHNVYINKDNPFPECGGYTPLKCYQRYPAAMTEPNEGLTIDDSYTIKEIQSVNLDGYERKKTLEDFIKKQVFDSCYSTKLTIKIFVNADAGKALCICNAKRWTVCSVVYNCLASFLPVVAPWLFINNPMCQELLDICKDLVNTEGADGLKAIEDAMKKFVAKYAKKPRVMSVFEVMAKKAFDARKAALENKAEDLNRGMTSLMNSYMEKLENLDQVNNELANMKYEPGGKTELDEYLENCDGIEATPDEANNNICIKTVGFMNVDPDAAEQVIRVGATWMSGQWGENKDLYWDTDKVKKFIKLLFVDHVAYCKVQSGFLWCVDGTNARVSPDMMRWELDEDCVWNPHHHYIVA